MRRLDKQPPIHCVFKKTSLAIAYAYLLENNTKFFQFISPNIQSLRSQENGVDSNYSVSKCVKIVSTS